MTGRGFAGPSSRATRKTAGPPSHHADDDGFSLEDAVDLANVSRETLPALSTYLGLLDRWRTRINLIGPAEWGRLNRRHVLDSLQIAPLIRDDETRIVDLGSGAGFPGAVLAAVFAGRDAVRVSLVEKSPRKCEFLDAVAKALDCGLIVRRQRSDEGEAERHHVVCARALAPLPRLLEYAEPWLTDDGRAIFLKGKDASSELTAARESWTFHVDSQASLSGPDGSVLILSSIKRRK
ncbi:16S rRNA (guanine(527)-N(7))-methyltransferase RsmG [bacterium]|nr:16S rRNA (guanine(527)-N(7))-methyltransferase RsmG [bacterium]